jgi:hypothetical protein
MKMLGIVFGICLLSSSFADQREPAKVTDSQVADNNDDDYRGKYYRGDDNDQYRRDRDNRRNCDDYQYRDDRERCKRDQYNEDHDRNRNSNSHWYDWNE